ncbi:MAG TPA: hypothetical protein DIC60_00045 [Lachnospiraceae bacterium]|nr:hypothetical protein [Lachnospiraceae bacterium]
MIYLLLITAIVMYDFTTMYFKKKVYIELVYKTSNPLAIFQISITILLLLTGIFNMAAYLKIFSSSYLYLFLTLIILVLQLSVHTFMKNGIGEKGIAIWGQYFSWTEIKSYKRKGNNLLFSVTVQFWGIKYQVIERCRIKPGELTDIEKFLSTHIEPVEMK